MQPGSKFVITVYSSCVMLLTPNWKCHCYFTVVAAVCWKSPTNSRPTESSRSADPQWMIRRHFTANLFPLRQLPAVCRSLDTLNRAELVWPRPVIRSLPGFTHVRSAEKQLHVFLSAPILLALCPGLSYLGVLCATRRSCDFILVYSAQRFCV